MIRPEPTPPSEGTPVSRFKLKLKSHRLELTKDGHLPAPQTDCLEAVIEGPPGISLALMRLLGRVVSHVSFEIEE